LIAVIEPLQFQVFDIIIVQLKGKI